MNIEKLGSWNFQKVIHKFESEQRNDIPLLIGKISQNHFLEGFVKGGYETDASAGGWPERTTKSKSDKKNPDKRRALLVKSGHLRRSVSLLEYKFDRIVIGTRGIPYAEVHNEGLEVNKNEHEKVLSFGGRKNRFVKEHKAKFQQKTTIKAHSFKMPKREFIGHSAILDQKILNLLKQKINSVFK